MAWIAPFTRMVTAAAVKVPATVDAHRTGGVVNWDDFGADMRESQGDANRPVPA